MSALTLNIQDHVTAALARVPAGLRPAQVAPAIGPVIVRLFQDHFRALPHNRRGFPTTHFWARAASATTWSRAADGLRINVQQEGVQLQLRGGDVQPVNSTYLTIPATAQAYGHRAAEFDLQFAIVVDGDFPRPALVARRTVSSLVSQTRSVGRASDAAADVVFYWLVRHAHLEPCPEVIPAEDEITQAAAETVRVEIEALWRQGGAK